MIKKGCMKCAEFWKDEPTACSKCSLGSKFLDKVIEPKSIYIGKFEKHDERKG